MAMDQFLAQMYSTVPGTKTAAAAEPNPADIEKQAHVDLFIKTATAQGIDLAALPRDQVADLFGRWSSSLSKTAAAASSQPPSAEALARADWEKSAAARAEFQEKFAEWDYAGRVMAHAYLQELGNIHKTAGEMPPQFAAAAAGKGKEEDGDDKDKKEKEEKDKKEKEASANAISVTAFDQAAAEYAFALVGEHNKTAGVHAIDPVVLERKLAAVLVLGPRPSEKIASAQGFEQARHLRGLELLEQAGYPVAWG